MQRSQLFTRVSGLAAGAFVLMGYGVAAAVAASEPGGLHPEVAAAFGIEAGTVVSIEMDRTPNVPVTVVVPIEGTEYTLDLAPHSVRGDDFVFLVQVSDGSYEEREPGPVRTLRGTIRELPGSVVAGSMFEEGLSARIEMPGGDVFVIEPLVSKLPDADRDLFVVFKPSDARSTGGVCGIDAHTFPNTHPGAPGQSGSFDQSPSTPANAGGPWIAQLACDADVEYFQYWGSEDATQARIEFLINTVNIQYERDVDVVHVITTIIVRTSEPDPYSSTSPATLLSQFRHEWNNNHANIERDLAHLFTGKNLDGNVIALANCIGCVCVRSQAYCLSRPEYSGSDDCATSVVAHVLAHLWSAGHCDCDGTMGTPCVNWFHPVTIERIIAHRNSRSCLEQTPSICIVHGDPAWDRNDPNTWTSFEDWAFSAYVDPKVESTDGINRDLGLTKFDVVFNTEPFGDDFGGPVTAANVSVSVTGGAAPGIANVIKNGSVLTVELNGLMPLQEWATFDFQVWSADGIEIADNGNEGEGVDECSRLDVGTLPGDVNNNGDTQPQDLSRIQASWSAGIEMLPDAHIRSGSIADYFDISRDGLFQPVDIGRVVAALSGSAPFTRNWNGVSMNSAQP